MLPVPMKESVITTFSEPEISIPSVLGLSPGALIVRPEIDAPSHDVMPK